MIGDVKDVWHAAMNDAFIRGYQAKLNRKRAQDVLFSNPHCFELYSH